MKATSSESIIGMSLAGFTSSGVGSVLAVVKNSPPSFSAQPTARPDDQSFLRSVSDAVANVFKNTVAFLGKAIFRSDVVFDKRPQLSRDTVGQAIISTGTSEVEVAFSEPNLVSPIVTASLSLTDNLPAEFIPRYAIYNVSATGFTIRLAEPVSSEVLVSWTAWAQSGN